MNRKHFINPPQNVLLGIEAIQDKTIKFKVKAGVRLLELGRLTLIVVKSPLIPAPRYYEL
jgi:hypothetical protein